MGLESKDAKKKILQRDITLEDLDMLKYFWEEKQDITRYCDFPNIKKSLKKEYPSIWKAWKQYTYSVSTLNQFL
jgi:hypothetical protein